MTSSSNITLSVYPTIKNYIKVIKFANWSDVTFIKKKGKPRYQKNPKRVHSFKSVKFMLAKNTSFLKPIVYGADLAAGAFYDKQKEITTLEYDEDICIHEIGIGSHLEEMTEESHKDMSKLYKMNKRMCKHYPGKLPWFRKWVTNHGEVTAKGKANALSILRRCVI